MSDMEAVKARYPGAICEHWSDEPIIIVHAIFTDATDKASVIGRGNDEISAWANARTLCVDKENNPFIRL